MEASSRSSTRLRCRREKDDAESTSQPCVVPQWVPVQGVGNFLAVCPAGRLDPPLTAVLPEEQGRSIEAFRRASVWLSCSEKRQNGPAPGEIACPPPGATLRCPSPPDRLLAPVRCVVHSLATAHRVPQTKACCSRHA